MRVLLVHAPKQDRRNGHDRFSIMVLPMGLLALADLTRRLGHEVEVLHLGVEKLLDPRFSETAYARAWRPDLVGYSLHWHAQLFSTFQSVLRMKQTLPQTPIVLGGLTAGFFSRQLLDREGGPDMVIRGEGERPWKLLLRALEEGGDLNGIPNLSMRGLDGRLDSVGSASDMAELRFSSFRTVHNASCYSGRFEADGTPEGTAEYVGSRIAYICAGRGCTADCAFCSGGATGQALTSARKGIVFRPLESLVQDVVSGTEEGVRDFGICFDPPRRADGYFTEFLDSLRRAASHPSLIFESYNGVPDLAFLNAFARTVDLDRSRLELSPHTASEEIRAAIGARRYDNAALEDVLSRCEALGIRTSVYFGLMPTSDWEETRRTAAWIERLAKIGAVQIYVLPIEAEPGSPWHTGSAPIPVPLRRRSFEDYLRRHAAAEEELTWPERLGYDLEDVEEKLRLMRSAAGSVSACNASPAGGA